MVVGARQADVGMSETADILGFSYRTFSGVYGECSEKRRESNQVVAVLLVKSSLLTTC